MSGRLKITDEGLCTVHSALEMATRHLEQVLRNVRQQDIDALGAPSLIEKADAFSGSWVYAIQQIGMHAADLDKFVSNVSDAFTQLDQQIQQDLTQSAQLQGGSRDRELRELGIRSGTR